MKKRKKKEEFLIMISAGILLAIIAMSGIYIKILNAEREFESKGQVGELYSEGLGNQPPSVSMINPSFIETLPQTEFTLSASYSDSDGISDLDYARLIIDKNVNNPNYTAMIDYFPDTNKITIYDRGEEDNLVAQYSFEDNIG